MARILAVQQTDVQCQTGGLGELAEEGRDEVTLFVRQRDGLVPRRFVTGARFVRLIGRHGFRSDPPERHGG